MAVLAATFQSLESVASQVGFPALATVSKGGSIQLSDRKLHPNGSFHNWGGGVEGERLGFRV